MSSATLWTATTQARIVALNSVLGHVAEDGTDLAQSAYDDARRTAQLTSGGALAAVLLMLLVALTLSRRISRPLRRLTAAATQVRDELPSIVAQVQADEDVDVPLPTVQAGGRNEVERLAAAFTDVNATTLRIAREQAVLRAAVAGMFVNVARRNQTLLSRQLSFIDHLERTEENPDSLENLFRLDHLAARMRRNAESLLVLAGVESGRRLRHAMPLSDVVRTATSEIEHFDRVSLVFQADPPVYPHLALPTAHLLAELLENATNFSDPGSEVIVATAGHADGVRLTITDSGLGMTDEELDEANARIAEPPASEGIGSQRLGFFVVGRLAQRLGAQVTLRGGRARGTVVTVDLPVSLFEAGSLAGLAPAVEEAAAAPAAMPATAPAPELPAGPGVPEPYTPPVPTVPETPAAASGGLPRRGAPAAPAATAAPAAPAVPAPAPAPEPAAAPEAPPQVPASRPGDDATAAPEAPAARSAEPTPAWSPTLPETWAPLPAQTEPGYQPEVRPGVGMPARDADAQSGRARGSGGRGRDRTGRLAPPRAVLRLPVAPRGVRPADGGRADAGRRPGAAAGGAGPAAGATRPSRPPRCRARGRRRRTSPRPPRRSRRRPRRSRRPAAGETAGRGARRSAEAPQLAEPRRPRRSRSSPRPRRRWHRGVRRTGRARCPSSRSCRPRSPTTRRCPRPSPGRSGRRRPPRPRTRCAASRRRSRSSRRPSRPPSRAAAESPETPWSPTYAGAATAPEAPEAEAADAEPAEALVEAPRWSSAPMDVLPARRGRAALRRPKKARRARRRTRHRRGRPAAPAVPAAAACAADPGPAGGPGRGRGRVGGAG